MPRLPPSLLRKARSASTNLYALLLACRDIPSASRELRWITEHVYASSSSSSSTPTHSHPPPSSPYLSPAFTTPARAIARLCALRARGVPLQYLLGSQPFGRLDVLCQSGVLIPRPETEMYTHHLAELICQNGHRDPHRDGELAVLDLCSGTGCISLGLFDRLRARFPRLRVLGVDVSRRAVRLARKNLAHNAATLAPHRPSQTITFLHADVLDPTTLNALAAHEWHVLVSNPPYIDPDVWSAGRGSLGLSVRRYEPELALVAGTKAPLRPFLATGHGANNHHHHHHDRTSSPPTGHDLVWERRDAFYGRLAEFVQVLKPNLSLWEVGDRDQAARVMSIANRIGLLGEMDVEIWRDWPDLAANEDSLKDHLKDNKNTLRWQTETGIPVEVKGQGNIRSVLLTQRIAST